MTKVVDIEIEKGTDVVIDVTIDPTDLDTGSLTGRGYSAYIQDKPNTVPLLTDAGEILEPPTARNVRFRFARADVLPLEGLYRWAVWRTDVGQHAATIEGRCWIKRSARG